MIIVVRYVPETVSKLCYRNACTNYLNCPKFASVLRKIPAIIEHCKRDFISISKNTWKFWWIVVSRQLELWIFNTESLIIKLMYISFMWRGNNVIKALHMGVCYQRCVL